MLPTSSSPTQCFLLGDALALPILAVPKAVLPLTVAAAIVAPFIDPHRHVTVPRPVPWAVGATAALHTSMEVNSDADLVTIIGEALRTAVARRSGAAPRILRLFADGFTPGVVLPFAFAALRNKSTIRIEQLVAHVVASARLATPGSSFSDVARPAVDDAAMAAVHGLLSGALSNLTSIDLLGSSDAGLSVASLALPSLRSVTLAMCVDVSPIGLSLFLEVSGHSLTSLDMDVKAFTGDVASALVRHCPNLSTLAVSVEDAMTAQCLFCIGSALCAGETAPPIDSDVEGSMLEDAVTQRRAPRLTRLELPCIGDCETVTVDDSDLPAMPVQLEVLLTPSFRGLSACNLLCATIALGSQLPAMVRTIPRDKLKQPFPELIRFTQTIPLRAVGHHLEDLDVSGSMTVDDDGMFFIAQLPMLRRLVIANTSVTDAGLTHLARPALGSAAAKGNPEAMTIGGFPTLLADFNRLVLAPGQHDCPLSEALPVVEKDTIRVTRRGVPEGSDPRATAAPVLITFHPRRLEHLDLGRCAVSHLERVVPALPRLRTLRAQSRHLSLAATRAVTAFCRDLEELFVADAPACPAMRDVVDGARVASAVYTDLASARVTERLKGKGTANMPHLSPARRHLAYLEKIAAESMCACEAAGRTLVCFPRSGKTSSGDSPTTVGFFIDPTLPDGIDEQTSDDSESWTTALEAPRDAEQYDRMVDRVLGCATMRVLRESGRDAFLISRCCTLVAHLEEGDCRRDLDGDVASSSDMIHTMKWFQRSVAPALAHIDKAQLRSFLKPPTGSGGSRPEDYPALLKVLGSTVSSQPPLSMLKAFSAEGSHVIADDVISQCALRSLSLNFRYAGDVPSMCRHQHPTLHRLTIQPRSPSGVQQAAVYSSCGFSDEQRFRAALECAKHQLSGQGPLTALDFAPELRKRMKPGMHMLTHLTHLVAEEAVSIDDAAVGAVCCSLSCLEVLRIGWSKSITDTSVVHHLPMLHRSLRIASFQRTAITDVGVVAFANLCGRRPGTPLLPSHPRQDVESLESEGSEPRTSDSSHCRVTFSKSPPVVSPASLPDGDAETVESRAATLLRSSSMVPPEGPLFLNLLALDVARCDVSEVSDRAVTQARSCGALPSLLGFRVPFDRAMAIADRSSV